MANRFDIITQQLFQKNISECSVEELENLANAYPYFAPAQYALLQKLKETDDGAYQAQLQKAILYHHDPFVFDQFINGNGLEFDYSITETAKDSDVSLLADSVVEPFEEVSPIKTEEPVYTTTKAEYRAPEEPEPEIAFEAESAEAEINATELETSPETGAIEEEEIPPVIEQEEVVIPIENAVPPPAEELPQEELEVPQQELVEDVTQHPVVEAHENNNGKEQLSFEPYHTVDYFASQGIKLSQEEVPKDRFGKQLKSFTEWLKTMKRLPVVDQIKSFDKTSTIAENDVESLAAHSVEGHAVYTEAMAEVWLRQGNKEKAIEIYNKLSLLNPSKRAYFATKIDSLK